MEKPVVQQVKEMSAELLPPQEQADMALAVSSELLPACQQFGQVYRRIVTGLNTPIGVAVDKKGQINVAEYHTISIYCSGKRIRSFGQEGSAPVQFQRPHGVAVNRAGNILVNSTTAFR